MAAVAAVGAGVAVPLVVIILILIIFMIVLVYKRRAKKPYQGKFYVGLHQEYISRILMYSCLHIIM